MTAWEIFKRIINECSSKTGCKYIKSTTVNKRKPLKRAYESKDDYKYTNEYLNDLEKRSQTTRKECILLCKRIKAFNAQLTPIEQVQPSLFLQYDEDLFDNEETHNELYGENEKNNMEFYSDTSEIPIQFSIFDGSYDLDDLCRFMDEEFPNLENDWD
jgi:hypothetical protein